MSRKIEFIERSRNELDFSKRMASSNRQTLKPIVSVPVIERTVTELSHTVERKQVEVVEMYRTRA